MKLVGSRHSKRPAAITSAMRIQFPCRSPRDSRRVSCRHPCPQLGGRDVVQVDPARVSHSSAEFAWHVSIPTGIAVRCRNPQRSTSRADGRIGHWRAFAMLPQRRRRLARLSQPSRFSKPTAVDPAPAGSRCEPDGQSTMDALPCRRYRSSHRFVAMNLRPITADRGPLD